MRRGRDACRLIAAFRPEVSLRRALVHSCDRQLVGNSELPIPANFINEVAIGCGGYGCRELFDVGSHAHENGKAVPLPTWHESAQFSPFTRKNASGCSHSTASSAIPAELASSSTHSPPIGRPPEYCSLRSSNVQSDCLPCEVGDLRSTSAGSQFDTPIGRPRQDFAFQVPSTHLPRHASHFRGVQQGFRWGESKHAAAHADGRPSASYLAGSDGSLHWRLVQRRLCSIEAARVAVNTEHPPTSSCSSSDDRSDGSSRSDDSSSSGSGSDTPSLRPRDTIASAVPRNVGEARNPSASASLSAVLTPASAHPSFAIASDGATTREEQRGAPGNTTNVWKSAVDGEAINGGGRCETISAAQSGIQSEELEGTVGSGCSLPAATSAAQSWRNRDILQPANLVSLARMLSGPPIA